MNDRLSRCTFLVVFYNVFFMFSSSVSVAVYMLFFSIQFHFSIYVFSHYRRMYLSTKVTEY